MTLGGVPESREIILKMLALPYHSLSIIWTYLGALQDSVLLIFIIIWCEVWIVLMRLMHFVEFF